MTQLLNTPTLSHIDHNAIAGQLRCPEGTDGIKVSLSMNKSHKNMIMHSIKALKLEEKNRLLELGHGNCHHLSTVYKQAEDLKYFGMEISRTMKKESEKLNKIYVDKNVANFQVYNGKNIPYVLNFFHRILTVNTIYFWHNPLNYLNEIYRVLRPKGIFVLAFVNEDFMKTIPFVTKKMFNLYNTHSITKLIEQTMFKIIEFETHIEPVILENNTLANKQYSIITLQK